MGGPEGEDADRLLNLVPEEAAARMGNRSDAPWCVAIGMNQQLEACGVCAAALWHLGD